MKFLVIFLCFILFKFSECDVTTVATPANATSSTDSSFVPAKNSTAPEIVVTSTTTPSTTSEIFTTAASSSTKKSRFTRFYEFVFGGSAFTSGDYIVAFGVPKLYGYVILVAIASSFVLMWMSDEVSKARKEFNVPYPTIYSSDNDHFNCYQTAYTYTLEGYPEFLLLLLVGGLEMPRWTALAGMVFLAGKVKFANGLYTGVRPNGARGLQIAKLGYLGLLLATFELALRLVTS